jgi:hypothetical protein
MNLMKTVAVSVTIDALAAPIGYPKSRRTTIPMSSLTAIHIRKFTKPVSARYVCARLFAAATLSCGNRFCWPCGFHWRSQIAQTGFLPDATMPRRWRKRA